MNETDKLYIKCRKDELINTLDSGLVKEAMQQYALVDAFVLDIIRIHTKKDKLEIYLQDQNKIKEKIKELGNQKTDIDKKLTKLFEEYGENAREMYTVIKEKL